MEKICSGWCCKRLNYFESHVSSFNRWIATINGPKDTVYENLSYKMTIHFNSQYPFKAPVVKFMNHCFHPNISPCGDICLDILKVKLV